MGAARADVVERPETGADQVDDRPDHDPGEEESHGGDEEPLPPRICEMEAVKLGELAPN